MVCKTSPFRRKPRNCRTLSTVFGWGLVCFRGQEVRPNWQDRALRKSGAKWLVRQTGYSCNRKKGVPRLLPKPCIVGDFTAELTSIIPVKNGQLKGNGRATTPHFGTRNQMPRKGLWVRIPCPPHLKPCVEISYARFFCCHDIDHIAGAWLRATPVLRKGRFHRTLRRNAARHPVGMPL